MSSRLEKTRCEGIFAFSGVYGRYRLTATGYAKDAPAGPGAELAQVRAQNPGERRCDRYPAPFPYWPGFEVSVLAPCAVVRPFRAGLGRGRAEPQFPQRHC